MAISATINAAFNIDNKVYNASVNIPNAAPTGAAPFKFLVTSQAPAVGGGAAPAPVALLTVAVGGSSQVYVAVAPPMDVISTAVGSNVVQNLDVVVSEGNYNVGAGTFS